MVSHSAKEDTGEFNATVRAIRGIDDSHTRTPWKYVSVDE